MTNVLIATLGESPAVVTEAIDSLNRRGIKIGIVVLLTTSDASAKKSVDLLCNHILIHYQGSYAVSSSIHAYRDVDSDEAAIEFMTQACSILRQYRLKGDNVYVCIAGGRKTMAALMTLAVQIHGATELFQVLVDDPELEEKGSIMSLIHLPREEQKDILHPDPSKVKVIRLPFIGLFPWIDLILKALQGGAETPRDVEELLRSNELIDEEGKPTPIGERIAKILEEVENEPPPYRGETKINITKREPKYHSELNRAARKLAHRFPFITEIRSHPWGHRPGVEEKPPNSLVVNLRKGGIILSLLLVTTASSKGQLHWAKKHVERYANLEL